jgi:uncharacterized cysteine cluster protein YcgN (CxxCxxCC family)
MLKSCKPFWKTKSLAEMTKVEWESLCDGCGRCCLEKLEDEDTGQIYYTSVACQFLDLYRCRCTVYEKRTHLEPDCLWLTPENVKQIDWMPVTCAYRRLAEGKDLEWWHPLVSGNADTVHEAGISVRGKALSGKHVNTDDLEAYVIDAEI